MVKNFIFLFSLLLSFQAFPQGKSDPTPEDVQQAKKLKSTYEDEDLVLLSKDIDVTFDLNKRDGLVEVFKKRKVNLMNISLNSKIQYPVFYDSESKVEGFELMDRRGRNLYNAQSQLIDQYINSQDIFHGDYRVVYSNLVFPLQGTSYHIETEKKYSDIKYFVLQYFSASYRIMEGKLTIHIPEWLDMEIVEYNFNGFDISKSTGKEKGGKTITYTFKNIPPRSDEPNVPGPSYIYPHVIFHAKSFTDDGTTKNLFNNVDDLYAWCNGLVKEVDVDNSVFSGKVEELTANAKTDEEKIQNIYYWIQDNIRYIAFEDGIAGFKPDSPQNVFKKRYGDCKGMAFLTKAMLEEAGFDSRLVWIGTDRLAYDYSVPSLAINNHMICAVKLDDKFIFLDATEKYNRFGNYATRIQNKQVMLQNGNTYKILTVPKSAEAKNIDKTSYNLIIEGNLISGSAERTFQNESRVMFQNIYTSFGSGDQTEVLSNFLASGNNNCAINNIAPFDPEKRDEALTLSYDLQIANAITEFDGVIYLDLDPVKNASEWIFSDREADYKFHIKQDEITKIELEIPEGYKVSSLPDDFLLSNEMVDIVLNYTLSKNKIIYGKKIHFKKRVIKKTDFETWNSVFDSLRKNVSRQITLHKI